MATLGCGGRSPLLRFLKGGDGGAGDVDPATQHLAFHLEPDQSKPSGSSRCEKGGLKGLCFTLLLALLLAAPPVFAQAATDPTPLQFSSSSEETRFHALVSELRCVMCQNQSLADSNAQIAVDLRHEVLALIREGKSNAQVKQFLVARYGEFVLYRPQVESKTWLLWFGPALLLLAGGFVIAGVLRRRGGSPALAEDDGQEW